MKYKNVKFGREKTAKSGKALKIFLFYIFLILLMMSIFIIGVIFLYRKITLKDEVCNDVNSDKVIDILENSSPSYIAGKINLESDDVNYEIHTKLKSGESLTSKDVKNYDFSDWNRTCSYEWRVVNWKNSLPKGFVVETEDFEGKKIGKIMSFYLKKLIESAKEIGLKISVVSGYRTPEYQKKLFDNELEDIKKKDKDGRNYDELSKIAENSVAKPYNSEHNAGLAVDLCRINEWFGNTEEYKWMCENAYKFGFILRYTSQNQKETGVMSEPWHWRYVGVDLAEKVKNSGKSFERFIIEDMIFPKISK